MHACSTARSMRNSSKSKSSVNAYNKCTRKNIDLEMRLTNSEPLHMAGHHIAHCNIDRFISSEHRERKNGIIDKLKNNGMRIIQIMFTSGNHSVIIVKNQYLPFGWALFDPNGSGIYASVNITTTKNVNVTKKYLSTISPRVCINYGTSTNNPGYCAIFGIIFMAFFKQNCNSLDWVARWNDVMSMMMRTRGNGKYNIGIELASDVQNIIHSHAAHACRNGNVEREIVSIINEYTDTERKEK